jgi:precorrin-6B methylase 2
VCISFLTVTPPVQALGPGRLAAQDASVVFDLGMGTGKILIQAFLQFKNLRYVFGIELSQARYK